MGMPEDLAGDSLIAPLLVTGAVMRPGLHELGLASATGEPVVVLTLAPFPSTSTRTVSGYRVGAWPSDARTRRVVHYSAPRGFLAVTPASAATPVSQHFTLADFLTHDQQAVWPKVLVLNPRIVDKLELIGDALVARGLPNTLRVMSGFRTPQYNAQGVGPKGGRARDSRHMYGDAADVFVDADGDGWMDDLNGDGECTIADARLLLAVAEQVERANPALIGGLSAYPATATHGPFLHVDARGTAARW